jgi:starvation-inducible DNA-binding protein
MSLHKLLDKLGEEVNEYVDEIAERATTLGGIAMGTVRMSARNSRLPEYPANIVDQGDHLETIADRFAAVAKTTREAIDTCDEAGDADTADLLTDVSRDLDKSLWFLEAHLQGRG